MRIEELPENRICEHVPGGMWNHAPIPTKAQDSVRCPCCGGGGCCGKDDDLVADPMLCPVCGVAAVRDAS